MPDEKKEYRVSGTIWDTILTGEESDQNFEKVPEIPEGLVSRTMEGVDKAAYFEIERNKDPKYIPNIKGERKGWFSRLYDSFRK